MNRTVQDLVRLSDARDKATEALFSRALRAISAGHIVSVPQAEHLATWEPSWGRPPLTRPDLVIIGPSALNNYTVIRDESVVLYPNPKLNPLLRSFNPRFTCHNNQAAGFSP